MKLIRTDNKRFFVQPLYRFPYRSLVVAQSCGRRILSGMALFCPEDLSLRSAQTRSMLVSVLNPRVFSGRF